MKFRTGLVSAVAGVSLLGAAGAYVAVSNASGPASQPATLVAAPAATTAPNTGSTPAPHTAAPRCDTTQDDAWPAWVDGVPPEFEAGAPAGVYLWHDSSGWHVRITHASDTHQVYSGVIQTAGRFFDVDAVKLEGNDRWTVGPEHHRIAFVFNNYGGVDGFDFKTACAPSISFDLRGDGHPLPGALVHVGHGAWHPGSGDFTIAR